MAFLSTLSGSSNSRVSLCSNSTVTSLTAARYLDRFSAWIMRPFSHLGSLHRQEEEQTVTAIIPQKPQKRTPPICIK
jgi:hypothetical protein